MLQTPSYDAKNLFRTGRDFFKLMFIFYKSAKESIICKPRPIVVKNPEQTTPPYRLNKKKRMLTKNDETTSAMPSTAVARNSNISKTSLLFL